MAKSTFMIPSMDCPAEEAVIRNRFKSVKGVDGLHFDLFNRRLTVSHTRRDKKAVSGGGCPQRDENISRIFNFAHACSGLLILIPPPVFGSPGS